MRWAPEGSLLSAMVVLLLMWLKGLTASGRGGGVVLLVGDVLAPSAVVAVVVALEQGDVHHEAVGGGAVPVVLARLEEDAVAGLDGLDRAALALAEADAFGDVDGLAERVGVPGGAGAGVKWTSPPPRRAGATGAATAST
jgi:hypothetical protein